MSGEEFDNFKHSFKILQEKLKGVRRERNNLNKDIKESINSFLMIESEIIKSLLAAKEGCNKQRDRWNRKIRKLRNQKIEYKHLLDNLIEEKKKIQEPRINNKNLKQIISIKHSIKEIESNIDKLESIIRTENLEINEENDLVEKIRALEEKKQELIAAQQDNDFYKIQRKIEIVELKIKRINVQLDKWPNKRRKSHIKMLNLYLKANELQNELKNKKKKIEKELKETKNIADGYLSHFLKLINSEKEISRIKRILEARYRPEPSLPKYIRNKKLFKRFKKEKLAIALDKKKEGKRMDFYEYKLILEERRK